MSRETSTFKDTEACQPIQLESENKNEETKFSKSNGAHKQRFDRFIEEFKYFQGENLLEDSQQTNPDQPELPSSLFEVEEVNESKERIIKKQFY